MKNQTLDDVFSEVDILFKSVKTSKIKVPSKVKNLFTDIKNYEDVCWYLGIKVLTVNDFKFLPKEQRLKQFSLHKIQNICKLFNGDWIPNWKDSSEKKWCPYYTNNGSSWSFADSFGYYVVSYCVAGFYKDQKTSDFCGKLFMQEYIDIIEN